MNDSKYSLVRTRFLTNISISEWSRASKEGRESVENTHHFRRTITSTTEEMVERINTLIQNVGRIAVRDIASTFSTLVVSADICFRKNIDYRKVSACWIQRMLREEHY